MMETERLIIRKIKEEDLDDIFNNWASDKTTNEINDLYVYSIFKN